jgi:hypothetical protein
MHVSFLNNKISSVCLAAIKVATNVIKPESVDPQR